MTATCTIQKQYGRKKDRYLELIQRFPLKRIESERELDAAQVVIDSLIDRPVLSEPEKDYLDVLGTLVYEYEETHYPMGEDIPDGDMLAELLGNREMTQAEFAKGVGMAVSTVSAIINKKREFTRKQLEKVAEFLNVSMDVFQTRR